MSRQGKEAAKSIIISGNYLPSPESDVNMFASCANYTKSSENLHSSQALLGTNEMLGSTPYDSQIECSHAALLQLTPPLSNPELCGTSSFSSIANEWRNISQSQPTHGCISQLPSGSLCWRSSPLTPSNRVGEAQYFQCSESDSRLFDILENETPDILKEASTPMTSVKINSPTQKRVSPPQSRHFEIGSSSSGGLRSDRKFIFESVPSFPSLSPCVNSKSNGDDDEEDIS